MVTRRSLTAEEERARLRLRKSWDEKKKQLGLTQESAASIMGWSGQASVYQYLSGKIALNMDATIKFCNLLAISPFDVYPELFSSLENIIESKQAEQRGAPLIDLIQAGVWSDVNDPYEMGDGSEQIAVDSDSSVDFFFTINGESMTPEFNQGDKVGIDTSIRPSPGDFVVAKLEKEEKATFKKYRDRGVDEQGNRIFDLIPLNEDYPTYAINKDMPARIVGVLVEHRKYRKRK